MGQDSAPSSESLPARVSRQTGLLAIAGIALAALAAYWVWDGTVASADQAVMSAAEALTESISGAVDGAGDELVAVSGLYRSSETVTRIEFARFVDSLGDRPGVVGLAFAPVLQPEDVPGYLEEVRTVVPSYQIHEYSETGERVPVADRDEHVPLQWLHPDRVWDGPYGFDMASLPVLVDAMADAEETNDVAATPFLQLPGQEGSDSLLLLLPVTTANAPLVIGYAVALVDLEPFLAENVPSTLASTIDWEVSDGSDVRLSVDPEHMEQFDVAGDRWQLAASGVPGTSTAPDPSAALAVLVAGIAASILAAFGATAYRQRSAANDELDRLRELGRAKDQFLASVGHELRTPLTGVVGFTELLRDPDVDLNDVERDRMIENIANEANDLAAIIDDILVSARSELDMVTVTAEAVDLEEAVEIVVAGSRDPKVDRVTIAKGDGRVVAVGDPARIRQILRNLLVNACRYGGDRMQIRLAVDQGDVRLRMADSGKPLPEDQWEKIFEPYYRAHDTETKPAALGIGLSVSRHLSRLMGGDLIYTADDGWSVFELRLPAVPQKVDTPAGEMSRPY